MAASSESRAGVPLTNLDAPLFDGAGATKRDLVDYLDAVADRIVPVLAGRALSVVRVLRGQDAFMQKNLPKYAPEWVPTLPVWAAASRRQVHYPLCDDRRTLLWFANQRAVEYHPTLFRGDAWNEPTHLVMDLDPPEGAPFGSVVAAAGLVREVLLAAGMAAAVKTSGAKGLHVVVPLAARADGAVGADGADGAQGAADGAPKGPTADDVAAATRAVAARAERVDPALATTAYLREERGGKVFLDSTRSGGATVVAAYSPRVRPGVPVSFPVAWSDLDRVAPSDATIRTAVGLLAGADPWREEMPAPQSLDADLVAEGHTIPVARVAAMHEGKRRARARRQLSDG
jgi:DNA ligase D-like protein (predicted polymerase)